MHPLLAETEAALHQGGAKLVFYEPEADFLSVFFPEPGARSAASLQILIVVYPERQQVSMGCTLATIPPHRLRDVAVLISQLNNNWIFSKYSLSDTGILSARIGVQLAQATHRQELISRHFFWLIEMIRTDYPAITRALQPTRRRSRVEREVAQILTQLDQSS